MIIHANKKDALKAYADYENLQEKIEQTYGVFYDDCGYDIHGYYTAKYYDDNGNVKQLFE